MKILIFIYDPYWNSLAFSNIVIYKYQFEIALSSSMWSWIHWKPPDVMQQILRRISKKLQMDMESSCGMWTYRIGILLPPYKLKIIYVNMLLTYVNVQLNNVDLGYNFVNMWDNYVNMRIKLYCISSLISSMWT